MKPLIILIATFALSFLAILLFTGKYNFPLAGRIAICVMLISTGIAHFVYTNGMTMMLPEFIPFRKSLVYLTGILEIAAAVALLIPSWQFAAAVFLIAFLVVLLPANIYAAYNHINYEKGTFDGDGLNYLWFRVPLQVLFIVWIYLSAIRF
ncbi:DoxX family protein [Pinibacter aurantiacus]|uniref:DoxX family membrane protein n=1 Tax=Pinibacter aurantiacus TaxID=2851599 RepID=A0A9E2SAT6_9BACT|nr:DoxX family protein [Pinibacter aurantiacus]MBV4359663.1 hypothetical protein [Pinibacter aurantiacus]